MKPTLPKQDGGETMESIYITGHYIGRLLKDLDPYKPHDSHEVSTYLLSEQKHSPHHVRC